MTEDRAARYSDLFNAPPQDDAAPARYKDLFEDSHDHTPDCAYCPVCATISAVRKTKPEILDHLASAAREVMLAAGMFLEELGEVIGPEPEQATETASEPPAPDNVRHIGPV